VTPKWQVLNLDPGYENDASHYEFNEFDYRETFSSTEDMTAALNFKVPYSFSGYASNVKVGAKYISRSKDRDDNRASYDWNGDDLYMSRFTSDRDRTDFFNDNYTFGEQADWDKIDDFFHDPANQADLEADPNYEDSEGASYKIKERIFAYYAMTDITFGKLNLLAGFRHEFTNNDLDGHVLVFNEEGDFQSLEPVSVPKEYNDIFPMVHFKYALDPETNIRLAGTRTMARPNYWDMAPYQNIDESRPRIRRGNPDLETTLAWNFDLMGSHYFQGVGIASAGLFYKDMSNISFEASYDETSGQYAGYEIETVVNGGDATLWGFELTWQQELSFLPGFWSGFGIYANYSHTWSDADLLGRSGVIPGQAGDVGNVSLAYESGPFIARISYNYQGEFIDQVGSSEDDDEWARSHGQLDFTGQYSIIDNLKIFVEVVNITNEPKYDFQGIEDRPIQVEYYSWWSRLGLKYTL
jgi:TonB-dependent receptor